MTNERKNEILEQILTLLTALVNDVEPCELSRDMALPKGIPTDPSKVEMLTIKECKNVIQGLTDNTVRHLVKQGKIKHIRTGEGKKGKILINKNELISYFAA